MRDLRELDPRLAAEPVRRDSGIFTVFSPVDKKPLIVVASTDLGWDHVSVSRKKRSPNQTELDYVFRLFFYPDETAVQFFVPANEHVNNMPFCLHLFRPQNEPIPKPPPETIGIGNEIVRSPERARELIKLAIDRLQAKT